MAAPMTISADTTAPASSAELAAMATLPAFLTDAQKRRLAKIKAGRQLFCGAWRRYLLTEGRTAHVFKELTNARGVERPLLVTVNVLGLAARKTADLLMLEPPGISAAEGFDAQQDAIDAINQASHIEAKLYGAALASTYEGEAWMQVLRFGGRTVIEHVPADQCFPVGDRRPDGTYPAAEKQWLLAAGEGRERRHYLRKEVHTAGAIANELWELNAYGRIERQVPLATYYGAEAPPEKIDTGVDEILLACCPNFRAGGENLSDFEGVDELVDQFTASVSQAARVLAIHADPKLGLPAEMFDESGKVRASDEAFVVETGGTMPQYLTWNAQMEASLKMIDNWLKWLLVTIEMSPSLLGLREGAAPDAYKKLRLEAANTLAKVGRKKLYWDRVLRDVYRRAAKLDQVSPGMRYDWDEVSIDWHDGIPLDEGEETEIVALQRSAGLVDRETAVEKLEGPERAPEIVDRLKDEDAAKGREMMNLTEREVQAGGEGDESMPVESMPTEPGLAQEIKVSEEWMPNGAQIQAAVGIVTAVVRDELPRDAALGLLEVMFNLRPEQAAKLLGTAAPSKPAIPAEGRV